MNRTKEELYIPEWLVCVEDELSEGMPDNDAKLWPEKFLKAIKPGIDLEKTKAPFLIFVLESALDKCDHEANPHINKAIDRVIYLYKNEGSIRDFTAARVAAYGAASAYAYSYGAYSAYAAAHAVHGTPEAPAHAVYAAVDASYFKDIPREQTYKKFATKLLVILRGLK